VFERGNRGGGVVDDWVDVPPLGTHGSGSKTDISKAKSLDGHGNGNGNGTLRTSAR